MHKLAIILLGLLVMLLPFGTSMNNSNALVIEEYDKDPYMRYAMDIANGYEDESGNNNYELEYHHMKMITMKIVNLQRK
jgi:hypothetical protein